MTLNCIVCYEEIRKSGDSWPDSFFCDRHLKRAKEDEENIALYGNFCGVDGQHGGCVVRADGIDYSTGV